MPYHWQRPTAEQEARGIVAVYVLTYSIWHSKKLRYEDIEMPCPYSVKSMQRRIDYSHGDLPYWIEVVQPLDKVVNDLDIFDLPDKEFETALENIA